MNQRAIDIEISKIAQKRFTSRSSAVCAGVPDVSELHWLAIHENGLTDDRRQIKNFLAQFAVSLDVNLLSS